MSVHTLKEMRQQFKDVGKFHTPPELAAFLRDLIPEGARNVYDPTCGAGALLAQFPDSTTKYGQDTDNRALLDAAMLPNFHGYHGDVLTDPAWKNYRFHAIVANPPFSVPWTPTWDERWFGVPVLPTKGRADWAFLIHIIHMLADDGTAAVLQFPGVLYRGGREQTLRQWLVTENLLDRVISIPGDTFTDTTISTACLVIHKDRADGAPIIFEDREHGISREVPVGEVEENDWALSVNTYVQPPQPEKEPVDPWELEQLARRNAVRELRQEVRFSRMVADIEKWPILPFLDELAAVIEQERSAT